MEAQRSTHMGSCSIILSQLPVGPWYLTEYAALVFPLISSACRQSRERVDTFDLNGRLLSSVAYDLSSDFHLSSLFGYTTLNSTDSQELKVLLEILRDRDDLMRAYPEAAEGNLRGLLRWATTWGITTDGARALPQPYAEA
jgi:hypothetical protein